MPLANEYRNLLVDTLRGNPFSFEYVWVGLLDPDGREITNADYQRAQVTFGPPSNGRITSTADVSFGPAQTTWGQVDRVGLYSDANGGILLAWQSILDPSGNPIVMKAADSLIFAGGNLSFRLS